MEPFTLPAQLNKRVPAPVRAYPHHIPLQLRFSDIDILGHLNNSVYLTLFDLGKTDFFTWLMQGPIDFSNVGLVIAHIELSFFRPIVFGDPIEVLTDVKAIGDKSITLDQRMVDTRDGQTCAICTTVMAAFDVKTGRSADLRPEWREALGRLG